MPSVPTARRRARSATRPRDTTAVPVDVVAVADVTPHMRRITLRAEALAGFTHSAPDQWVRLFLPRPGQDRPILPVTEAWWPELCAMPDEERPILRNYTVRRFRPAQREIDVDFVLHGDAGPASAWAERAAPGDRVGILGQTAPYHPHRHAAWQLIAGDETALPAIGAIVESLDDDARAEVLVEIAGPEDVQELTAPPGVGITWLPRRDAAVGEPLLEALTSMELPGGEPYVWVAGESAMVQAVRRHLVRVRGVAKESICFVGYWRRDAPAYEE